MSNLICLNHQWDRLIHKFVKIKFDCDISLCYFVILQCNISSLNITIYITIFHQQCCPLLYHHYMVNNLPLPRRHFTSKCGIFYEWIFNVETCLFIFANCYCINFMLQSLFVEFINSNKWHNVHSEKMLQGESKLYQMYCNDSKMIHMVKIVDESMN